MAATTASKLANDTGKRAATLIFLHGLGDTPAGWKQTWTKYLDDPSLSHINLILPVAPIRYPPGYSWHHIRTLPMQDIEDANNIEKASLAASVKVLDALIKEQVDAGVPLERIVLGGFSQGAAMSLATAFTTSQDPEREGWKLGGVIALSGYIPRPDDFQKAVSPSLKDTPIFWGHGTEDNVIEFPVGEASVSKLRELSGPSLSVYKIKHTEHDWHADTHKRVEDGAGTTWKREKHAWIERHEYDGMHHGPSWRWHDQAMEKHLREWLRRVLPA